LRCAFIEANPDGVIGNFSDIAKGYSYRYETRLATVHGQLSQSVMVESQPFGVPLVQSPEPALGAGHVAAQSAPFSHRTSHSHELAQLTASHAELPLQVTSHDPVPHVTVAHALTPSHSTSHEVARLQSTFSHALEAVQSTSHSKPEGQAMLPHPFAVLQTISHVINPKSQLVHGDGHGVTSGWSASGGWLSVTQNPFVHSRPSLQSGCAEHSKSAVLRLTRQLVAATPRIASPHAATSAAFIARRP
jgi:hypothetical protein